VEKLKLLIAIYHFELLLLYNLCMN